MNFPILSENRSKKAYEQRFLGIIVKGCLFHSGQCLFKIFVKHGFKTAYLENEHISAPFLIKLSYLG